MPDDIPVENVETGIFRKICTAIIAFIITFLFPYIGSLIADRFAVVFSIEWLYIHHFVQLILSLIAIFMFQIMIGKKWKVDWGLNLKDKQVSIKLAGSFAVGWFIISLLLNMVFHFRSTITYPLTTRNIVFDLFFDFVMTGISEEVLFRGLIMGLLLYGWGDKQLNGGIIMSIAAIITTCLFAMAHIGVDWKTFTITSVPALQILFAIGLGTFYAVMREKTGSLLGPILAHGASDGLITVVQLLLR